MFVKNRKLLTVIMFALFVGSADLAFQDQFEALFTVYIVIVFLLPPLLWALSTDFVAIQVISFIAFATQIVTAPYAYLYPDLFIFRYFKGFGFTAVEAFPLIAKVSLYVLSLNFFFIIIYRWLNSGNVHMVSGLRLLPSAEVHNKKSKLFSALIVLITSAMIPVHIIMYSNGIGIIGAEPPALPFKLAGLLHYNASYFIPFLLAVLYWKSKRNFSIAIIILGYGLLSGITSGSRSQYMKIVLPLLFFAWKDHRNIKFLVYAWCIFYSFSVVSHAKTIILQVVDGVSMVDVSMGIFDLFLASLNEVEPFRLLAGIFGRLDGFSNLIMASNYNIYEVASPGALLWRCLYVDFASVDVDLHHIQWQGAVQTRGFYNGGSLLTNAVILGNARIIYILIYSFLQAAVLAVAENIVYNIIRRQHLPNVVRQVVGGLLTGLYFIGVGGSKPFYVALIMLYIAGNLPWHKRLAVSRIKCNAG